MYLAGRFRPGPDFPGWTVVRWSLAQEFGLPPEYFDKASIEDVSVALGFLDGRSKLERDN